MATRKGSKQSKKLNTRKADWKRMVAQQRIGDGHRDSSGYRMPGSNKK